MAVGGRPIRNCIVRSRLMLTAPGPIQKNSVSDGCQMSHKVIVRRQYVTVFRGIGDIMGPSHKKIKVVSNCRSIYAYGLTIFSAGENTRCSARMAGPTIVVIA